MEQTEYTLSILVENIPGVLGQIANLFSQRGYNIDSIASGPTEDPEVTRITIVLHGDEAIIKQISAQLSKRVCVISVKPLFPDSSVKREFVLVKVNADSKEKKDTVIQIANIFRVSIVDVSRETLTLAVLGNTAKIDALLDLLKDFKILEIVRTGAIAIERGSGTIYDRSKDDAEFNYGKSLL